MDNEDKFGKRDYVELIDKSIAYEEKNSKYFFTNVEIPILVVFYAVFIYIFNNRWDVIEYATDINFKFLIFGLMALFTTANTLVNFSKKSMIKELTSFELSKLDKQEIFLGYLVGEMILIIGISFLGFWILEEKFSLSVCFLSVVFLMHALIKTVAMLLMYIKEKLDKIIEENNINIKREIKNESKINWAKIISNTTCTTWIVAFGVSIKNVYNILPVVWVSNLHMLLLGTAIAGGIIIIVFAVDKFPKNISISYLRKLKNDIYLKDLPTEEIKTRYKVYANKINNGIFEYQENE
ncbi:MAG TPA: hypothetical protein DEP72_01365 [Clostridiales bacterium]|nr:MAG: hypothetical protein A2Y18_05100 [Clostridiales bacterium GWD2_32_19]HCC06802.1 hypothetical protein [Clostridiales bacterium]